MIVSFKSHFFEINFINTTLHLMF